MDESHSPGIHEKETKHEEMWQCEMVDLKKHG